MKHKMLALILALTVASWAQTASQTAPSAPEQNSAEKSKCACCDKMASADSKDPHASCMGHSKEDAKSMGSCCSGKDAKSCMKGDETAASCCKDSCGKDKTASMSCGKECGKKCEKGCCSSEKKTAKNCCDKNIRG
jgi:hypothetical protein